MQQRFLSIWFRHLTTDWLIRRRPHLKGIPFVLASPERGKMMIKATSVMAQSKGIHVGMVVADSKAILPELEVLDDQPRMAEKLLKALAEWCIRYTPIAAVDMPDGLILDVTGCTHLWGGERAYMVEIVNKLRNFGYDVRAAMADTMGCAWAISHFGRLQPIIEPGKQRMAMLALPPAALKLDADILERLDKLGLYQVQSFINMPRSVLRRRFGDALLSGLDKALGLEREAIIPIIPIPPYQERLTSMDPIRTAKGIEIGLRRMLETLCKRFAKESKGLKTGVFKGYREDGNIQQIHIGTNRPSRNVDHLFRLFELKIATMAPGFGFTIFVLEATVVEELSTEQETLWSISGNDDDLELAELLDRMAAKVGSSSIHRYLPQEHYWPERSIKIAASLQEKPTTNWRIDRPRPMHLLLKPETIKVTVPVPDYPPMLFHYKGKLHKVKKADGPERIEKEWWLEESLHRDYYCVEDEEGGRYWIFRLGHYSADEDPQWFMHGFFA